MTRAWFLMFLIMLAVAGYASREHFQAPTATAPKPPRGVIPGEFEPIDAIAVAWSRNKAHMEVLANLAGTLDDSITVLLLVPNNRAAAEAAHRFQDAGVNFDRVKFLKSPVQLPWIRDFGPQVLRLNDGTYELLDAIFLDDELPLHDVTPMHMADSLEMKRSKVPLRIEGGNLLSNGEGLIVTTSRVFDENKSIDRDDLLAQIKDYYGGTQIVVVEPMQGEPNGHVDMFATFTAPNTIVVGTYDTAVDKANSAILHRNAETLKSVVTNSGPLDVHRIPMPPRKGGLWMTHTNVVFANGTLVVPTYADADGEIEATALSVYRQLLPEWNVVPVDATAITADSGSLHCITLGMLAPKIREPTAAVSTPAPN